MDYEKIAKSHGYTLWPCDDGTIDVLKDETGPVIQFTNLPAENVWQTICERAGITSEKEKMFTVRESFFDNMLDQIKKEQYEKGENFGRTNADGFYIEDTHDGGLCIRRIEAPSRRALARKVQELNPGHIDTGCGHDCSGRICGQSATMLRAYRRGNVWVGVVEISWAIDV